MFILIVLIKQRIKEFKKNKVLPNLDMLIKRFYMAFLLHFSNNDGFINRKIIRKPPQSKDFSLNNGINKNCILSKSKLTQLCAVAFQVSV